MDTLTGTLLAICIAAVLLLVAYKKGFLTNTGILASFISAVIIAYCGNFWWFAAYMLFPMMAFAATFTKIKKKKAMGLQEGKAGERGHMNILGVGLIPTIVSVVYFIDDGGASPYLTVAFLAAIAVSVADTTSSEIGVFDKDVWMITTLKKTEPGINGGISRLGLVSSAITSLVFAILSYALVFHCLDWRILIVWVCGMVGNLLDSVVGAVWENKGRISKYGNNIVTALSGAVIGFLLCLIVN